MRKRSVGLFLCAVMLFQLAGCATVQKKFTRKKKEPKHVAQSVYFEEGPYQKKYSNDYYYKTHYTMWKTWHDDLIKSLGGNRKKTARNYEETLNHLAQMRNYLVPEKQKELDPLLETVRGFARKFETGAYSKSQEPGIRTELQKVRRLVASNFYYDKVASQLLPDTVNLGAPAPAPSASPAASMPLAPDPTPSASPSTAP